MGICNQYKLVFGKQLPIITFLWFFFMLVEEKCKFASCTCALYNYFVVSHDICNLKLSIALNKLHKTIVENLDEINNQCI